MKRPERLEDYLEHIYEASSRAMSYVQQTPDLVAFQKDHRTQDAVVRNIEIIGEAVSKLQKSAPDFIDSHPGIPWAKIRAMRNLVIHEYFFLDLKVVWSTVKDELPKLAASPVVVIRMPEADLALARRQAREARSGLVAMPTGSAKISATFPTPSATKS